MIHKRRALTLGLAAMVLGLVYAGLQPFGFSPPNRARPPSSGPGLTFEAPSMAISESGIEWEGDAASAEISMHIWIEPGVPSRAGSGALLSLVDGSERPSFLVAQWKGGLNLRVRSDNRRGYWEIGAPGVLVAGDDPRAMARGIGELLDAPERRAELGARGRRGVVQAYSWPRIARATAEIYAEVAAEWRGRPESTTTSARLGIRRASQSSARSATPAEVSGSR